MLSRTIGAPPKPVCLSVCLPPILHCRLHLAPNTIPPQTPPPCFCHHPNPPPLPSLHISPHPTHILNLPILQRPLIPPPPPPPLAQTPTEGGGSVGRTPRTTWGGNRTANSRETNGSRVLYGSPGGAAAPKHQPPLPPPYKDPPVTPPHPSLLLRSLHVPFTAPLLRPPYVFQVSAAELNSSTPPTTKTPFSTSLCPLPPSPKPQISIHIPPTPNLFPLTPL